MAANLSTNHDGKVVSTRSAGPIFRQPFAPMVSRYENNPAPRRKGYNVTNDQQAFRELQEIKFLQPKSVHHDVELSSCKVLPTNPPSADVSDNSRLPLIRPTQSAGKHRQISGVVSYKNCGLTGIISAARSYLFGGRKSQKLMMETRCGPSIAIRHAEVPHSSTAKCTPKSPRHWVDRGSVAITQSTSPSAPASAPPTRHISRRVTRQSSCRMSREDLCSDVPPTIRRNAAGVEVAIPALLLPLLPLSSYLPPAIAPSSGLSPMGEDDSVFSSDYESGAASSLSGASAGECAATAVVGPFESSGTSSRDQGELEGALEGLSAGSDASFLSVLVDEPPPITQMSPALRSILKKYEAQSQSTPRKRRLLKIKLLLER